MSTPDALRLADRLDANLGDTRKPAAAELRRQHAEIERLRDELNLCCELKREYQEQAAAERERWATAARLVVEASPEQLPLALDALADVLRS